MADSQVFTVDSMSFGVYLSAGVTLPATGYFRVSTDGTTHISNFVVSAVAVSGNAAISGNLTVAGNAAVSGTVSVLGKLTANAGFVVSAISSLTGAVNVGGALQVTGITSLDGATNQRGAFTAFATVDVSIFLQPHVTIGVSSLNPLVATRYFQVLAGSTTVFIPFVSVLPT